MATNLFNRCFLSRSSLLLVSLLILVGILSGCAASSTAVPSHPTGSIPTSTPPQQLKGTISEFLLPTPNLYPGGMTAGPDGNLWFSESACAKGQSDKIGRITTAGTISEFSLPTPQTQLYGMTTGSDGNLWFSEADSNNQNSKIGRLTPTGTISEFPLPTPPHHPFAMMPGPSCARWYSELARQ